MKPNSVSILKLALGLIGVWVPAILALVFYTIGFTAYQEMMQGSTLGYIIVGILALITLSVIPFYNALFQAYRLLNNIVTQEAFSEKSLVALNKIKSSAYMITGIYLIMLPLIFAVAQWDDAPGLVAIGLVPAFVSFAIAVFATVLQQLFKEALIIRHENEGTI